MKLHILTAVALSASLALAPNLSDAQAQEKEKKETPQQQEQKQQATDQQQQQKTDQIQQRMTGDQQQQTQYAQQLQNADKVKGMKIQNNQGEEVGSIDKVVLDSKEGKIAYVVLTSGGFWGIGGEKLVVPWNALNIQQQQGEQVVILDVTRDQLKKAPQGELQENIDREQGRQIHQYYGVSPYWEGQQQQQTQQQQQQKMAAVQQKDQKEQKQQATGQQQQQQQSEYAQKLQNAEDIQNMKVQNQQGEEIGSIEKFVIDTEEGKVAYVVLTSGGFWGMAGDKAVVPWNALNIQQQQGERVVLLDVTKDQLKQAPQGELQQSLDREQGRQIHQHYGVSPYWEDQQKQQQKQPQMQQKTDQKKQKQQASKQQQQQQSQYAQQLQNADDIKEMKIQNRQGEEVGSIDQVVIDAKEGKLAYIVLTSGGFWGMGGEQVVVPWNAVELQQLQGKQQEQQHALVLDVTKDQLEGAPQAQGELQQTIEREQGRQIHQHYGVSPYWEDQQKQQQKQPQMKQDKEKQQ